MTWRCSQRGFNLSDSSAAMIPKPNEVMGRAIVQANRLPIMNDSHPSISALDSVSLAQSTEQVKARLSASRKDGRVGAIDLFSRNLYPMVQDNAPSPHSSCRGYAYAIPPHRMDPVWKEDVASELEDFVLLARLGANGEAYDLYRIVLYDHVAQFPVFAEVAAFLLENRATYENALGDLLKIYERFPESAIPEDQKFFMKALAFLIEADAEHLLDMVHSPTHEMSRLWDRDAVSTESSIQAQLVELLVTVLSQASINEDLFIEKAWDFFKVCKSRQLFWEASHIFQCICSVGPRGEDEISYDGRIAEGYEHLKATMLESASGAAGKLESALELPAPYLLSLAVATRGRIGYLINARRFSETKHVLLQVLTPLIEHLGESLRLLFSVSPIKKPCGALQDFYISARSICIAEAKGKASQLESTLMLGPMTPPAALGHPFLSEVSEEMSDFIGIAPQDFIACAVYARLVPAIWNEDLGRVQQAIVGLLHQQKDELAMQATQRMLMLSPNWHPERNSVTKRELIEALDHDSELQANLARTCQIFLQELKDKPSPGGKQKEPLSESRKNKESEDLESERERGQQSQDTEQLEKGRELSEDKKSDSTGPANTVALSSAMIPAGGVSGRTYEVDLPHSRIDVEELDISFAGLKSFAGPATEVSESIPTSQRDSYERFLADFVTYDGAEAINTVFGVGSFFAVFWHENYGPRVSESVADRMKRLPSLRPENLGSGFFSRISNGDVVFSCVRRLIVVSQRDGFSIAIPVSNYNGRGLSKANLPESELQAHAILYCEGMIPVSLEGELNFTKRPICVTLTKKAKQLSAASRIYYGKPYSIEHSSRVQHLGHVVKDDTAILRQDYLMEAAR